jgi:hypothetical protein
VGLQVQVQQHQPQGGIAVLFLNILFIRAIHSSRN